MADPESAEARAAVKTLWQPVRRPRQRQTAPDSARQRQTAPDEPQAEVLKQMCHSPCAQVLELTHNHGTEKDDAFHVHTGNSEPLGFGHIGFLKPAGRGEGLLIAGERRASFSRLPRRRPRGNVQGDGAGVKPLPAPSLPRQSRQRRGGGGMAVTTARGVMVASEREGADGLLLPLSREPSSSRSRGEGPRAALSRCSSRAQAGVPFHKRPQDGGMSSLAFALDPSGALLCGAVPARPVNSIALTRRAANRLPGRARAARRLVRRRVLQLLRSGGRGPACAARQRHAVSRLFGSLPFPRPGARRARGVRPTADAATPGPRVHCSLFHNWPRSRHCARAFVQRKPNTCTLCPSASANMHTLRGAEASKKRLRLVTCIERRTRRPVATAPKP